MLLGVKATWKALDSCARVLAAWVPSGQHRGGGVWAAKLPLQCAGRAKQSVAEASLRTTSTPGQAKDRGQGDTEHVRSHGHNGAPPAQKESAMHAKEHQSALEPKGDERHCCQNGREACPFTTTKESQVTRSQKRKRLARVSQKQIPTHGRAQPSAHQRPGAGAPPRPRPPSSSRPVPDKLHEPVEGAVQQRPPGLQPNVHGHAVRCAKAGKDHGVDALSGEGAVAHAVQVLDRRPVRRANTRTSTPLLKPGAGSHSMPRTAAGEGEGVHPRQADKSLPHLLSGMESTPRGRREGMGP